MASTATQSAVELRCSGSPAEMGYAQGAALRGKIRAVRRELVQLEAFRLQRPWWLPFGWFRRAAERRAHRRLHAPLSRRYPEMAARLEGIAEGAGVQLRTLHLVNAMESVLSSLSRCTAPLGGCSAVAVRGARSATGSPIIARNFDYLPLVQPYYVVRESSPDEGHRALEFTMAPLAGTVDGVNERGLCITFNYAFTHDEPDEPAAPISMVIGEALQRCDTVKEAAAWIADRPRWGGGLLMLADAGGDIASLELSSTRSHLRRPAPGEDCLFHTNVFFSEAMRDVQLPVESVYTDRAPVALRGRRLHESSEIRDGRFAELLATRDVWGPDELAALMADHGPDDAPDQNSLCVHSDYWYTTSSLQLLADERRMRVSYSTACEARYREAELAAA